MSDLIERQWKRKIKSKETLQRMAGFHLIEFTSGTNIKEEREFPWIASYSEFSTLL
jgi:hypothetical protein